MAKFIVYITQPNSQIAYQPNKSQTFGYLAIWLGMLNRHPMAIVDIFQSRKIITGKKFKIESEDRDMVCNFTHNVYLYTELQNAIISLFQSIQIYFKQR